MLAQVLLAFLFLHLLQNDTIPQGYFCHKTLFQKSVLCVFCFDWLHSGLRNDGKDRLKEDDFKSIEVIRINGKIYIFFCIHLIQSVYQPPLDHAFHENDKNNYFLYGFGLLLIWLTLWLAESEISAGHYTHGPTTDYAN